MDIPAKVYITCPSAELKKQPGTLIAVSANGYYEVHVQFGSNITRCSSRSPRRRS